MDASPWTLRDRRGGDAARGQGRRRPAAGHQQDSRPAALRLSSKPAATVGNAALVARAVGVQRSVADSPSDRGLPQYRIVRDGCFTIATPLPAGTRSSDIRAIRVHAFERPPAEGKPRVAADPVTLTRINKVFMLDEHDLPGPSILKWEGSQTIRAGGEPFEVKVP